MVLALIMPGACERKPVPAPPARPAASQDLASSPTPPRTAPPASFRRRVLEHGEALRLPAHAFHSWSPGDEKRDPQTFRIGDMTLTLASSEKDASVDYPRPYGLMLRVSAPGLRTRTLTLDGESRTYFGVGRIDMSRPGPQLLFETDSGGRGCCHVFYLLSPAGNGAWRLDTLERWNIGPDEWARDRDGDGSPELRVPDETFVPFPWPELYEWAPSRYFQIEHGKAVDVSTRPGLAGEYRRYVRRALPACRKHENAACTGLMAASWRIGRDDWAWKVVLNSYDRKAGVPWLHCDMPNLLTPEESEACKDPETAYPATLPQFLADAGYWPTVDEKGAAAR